MATYETVLPTLAEAKARKMNNTELRVVSAEVRNSIESDLLSVRVRSV